MDSQRRLFAAALIFAALPLATLARADEPIDAVLLSNGGRLRGTVLEHEVKTGTTIRLIDGTTRKLKPAEIARIEYGEPAAPAAPSPPAPSPAPPAALGAAPAPVAATAAIVPAESDTPPLSAKSQMRSTPLLVTGVVMVGIGAVVTVAGAALFAANAQTKDAPTRNCGDLGCTTGHESYVNTTGKTDGEAMLIGGGLGMATGLVLALVGVQRVAAKPAAEARSFSLEPTVGRRTVGLALHF